MTIVNSSSICCSDSLHSLSASDTYSSSSTEELVDEEGRESMSASELSCGSMKLWLLLRDMVAVSIGCEFERMCVSLTTVVCYRICIDGAEV